jgi:hypothetical protein
MSNPSMVGQVGIALVLVGADQGTPPPSKKGEEKSP